MAVIAAVVGILGLISASAAELYIYAPLFGHPDPGLRPYIMVGLVWFMLIVVVFLRIHLCHNIDIK